MKHLTRNITFTLVLLVIIAWSIFIYFYDPDVQLLLHRLQVIHDPRSYPRDVDLHLDGFPVPVKALSMTSHVLSSLPTFSQPSSVLPSKSVIHVPSSATMSSLLMTILTKKKKIERIIRVSRTNIIAPFKASPVTLRPFTFTTP